MLVVQQRPDYPVSVSAVDKTSHSHGCSPACPGTPSPPAVLIPSTIITTARTATTTQIKTIQIVPKTQKVEKNLDKTRQVLIFE